MRMLRGGTEGNERLTVQTGAVLFVLLAALGITILRIGQLTWLHLFLGLLLIGPVLLKLASTGYRFARYYTHDAVYVAKGPPAPALRLLAPAVVVTTVGVFASGVVLLALGPSSRSTWLLIHKVFFIAWIAVTTLHVLGHLPEMRRGLLGGRRDHDEIMIAAGAGPAVAGASALAARGAVAGRALAARVAGGGARTVALTLALAGGLALALALVPDFGPWVHHHPVGDH